MQYFHYIRKSTDDDEHQALSLESQARENVRRFADAPDVDILAPHLEESRSAKTPGRPVFNAMLAAIERGEADGILAWHPDRLARNSVDGGRIIYLLDTGKLKDLKFSTYTFENTAQGKFMLQIVFANSKYQVDSLSDNVKRGNRTKMENGWRPNRAPIGYLNVGPHRQSTIAADPDRFPLVRRLWETALTRAYTIPQLADMAAKQWGLTTVRRKRVGGNPLTISGLYQLFQNPFYAGIIRHGGKDYPGKHPPMVSLAEFDAVQAMLGRDDAPRNIRYQWNYTGILKCVCRRSITAEHKVNRFGSRYVYYHCSRGRYPNICREPSIEVAKLEEQMRAFIASVTLAPEHHDWAQRIGRESVAEATQTLDLKRNALVRLRMDAETALRNTRHMRTHEQITEEEFLADRAELEKKRAIADDELNRLTLASCIEPEEAVILLNVRALSWFDEGDGAVRRLLLEAMASNPVIRAGSFTPDAAFPFVKYDRKDDIQRLCAVLHDVRTHPQPAAFSKLVKIVRQLRKRFGEPDLGAAA